MTIAEFHLLFSLALFFCIGFGTAFVLFRQSAPTTVNTAINASDCVMTGGPQNCPECGAKL